jgi:hypothetical protein
MAGVDNRTPLTSTEDGRKPAASWIAAPAPSGRPL